MGVVFYTCIKTVGVVHVQYVCENIQHRINGLFPEAAVSVCPVVNEPPPATITTHTKTNAHTHQSFSVSVTVSLFSSP